MISLFFTLVSSGLVFISALVTIFLILYALDLISEKLLP